MSSSLNLLKKATKRALEEEPIANQSKRSKLIYPLFNKTDEASIESLKKSTHDYADYAPDDWLSTLNTEESDIITDALNDGKDPYEAVINHWVSAIRTGKIYYECSLSRNKVMSLAYSLNEYGFVRMSLAKHYIDCAITKTKTVSRQLHRLNEIVEEFESALNEKRHVCMCKETPCCCK